MATPVDIVRVCHAPARQGASDGHVGQESSSAGDAGASWDEWYDECPETGHAATNDAVWDAYDDAWTAGDEEDLDGQPCPLIANLSTSVSNWFSCQRFPKQFKLFSKAPRHVGRKSNIVQLRGPCCKSFNRSFKLMFMPKISKTIQTFFKSATTCREKIQHSPTTGTLLQIFQQKFQIDFHAKDFQNNSNSVQSATPCREKIQHSPTKGTLKILKMLARRNLCTSRKTSINGVFRTESHLKTFMVLLLVIVSRWMFCLISNPLQVNHRLNTAQGNAWFQRCLPSMTMRCGSMPTTTICGQCSWRSKAPEF